LCLSEAKGMDIKMKKVFCLVGSRRKNGNTAYFIKNICDKLSPQNFEIEWGFPQDFRIDSCMGCNRCFAETKCIYDDDINLLQRKTLESDILIIASPVYLHYMTGDLKLILDRFAWWAHTLRLQGKPVVVLSTCSTNGTKTVIEPLSNLITYMGGNVIATANAAEIPNQINNKEWMEKVTNEISERIKYHSNKLPQSNPYIEKVFAITKPIMEQQLILGDEYKEGQYWKETGMIQYKTFQEYLEAIQKKGVDMGN